MDIILVLILVIANLKLEYLLKLQQFILNLMNVIWIRYKEEIIVNLYKAPKNLMNLSLQAEFQCANLEGCTFVRARMSHCLLQKAVVRYF